LLYLCHLTFFVGSFEEEYGVDLISSMKSSYVILSEQSMSSESKNLLNVL